MFWMHKTIVMKISSVIYTLSEVIYKIGVLEYWSTGIEKGGISLFAFPNTPSLQYSSTPKSIIKCTKNFSIVLNRLE
jgi:hypothetical protein